MMQNIAPIPLDAGEITVVKRAAAHTFGRWDVTWPEDFNAPDLGDDRELGWVAELADPPQGRFNRRFVSTDAEIDAVNNWSNVEVVLDEAEGRTASEVVTQRDVVYTGNLVPGLDFDKGDVLPWSVWGGVLDLPVTEVMTESLPGDPEGVRLHVAGQLLHDDVALELANSSAERTIRNERRARARAVAQARDHSWDTRVGLTGLRFGDVWDAATNGGRGDGALGEMNYRVETAQQRADDAWDASEAITEQGGLLDQVENDVQAIDNVVNGTSPPQYNGNLWKAQSNVNRGFYNFGRIQEQINWWVNGSINALDRRIPVALSIDNRPSVSGVGRIWFDLGDNLWFEKWCPEPVRIGYTASVAAVIPYTAMETADISGPVNTRIQLRSGLAESMTRALVTVYRRTPMPRMTYADPVGFEFQDQIL